MCVLPVCACVLPVCVCMCCFGVGSSIFIKYEPEIPIYDNLQSNPLSFNINSVILIKYLPIVFNYICRES